ncbi:MAG: hypothetical protein GY757_59345, partial [bacterium]|nr:hypothetical protein [bacterium]
IITGVYIEFWWLAPFFNSLPYSFGPLIYFYMKALTEPGIRYSRLQLLHALPVVLAAIYYSAVFFLPAVAREAFLYRIYFDKSLAASLSMYISMTQALIYVLLCFRLFKAHSQKIKKTYSDLEKINLAWIRHLVVLFIAIWVVAAGLQSFLPEELISAKLDDAITYFCCPCLFLPSVTGE